jgi:hypothetical protein
MVATHVAPARRSYTTLLPARFSAAAGFRFSLGDVIRTHLGRKQYGISLGDVFRKPTHRPAVAVAAT